MGILQKIEWKTRRWNLKVNLLDIFIHDGDGCWGFTLFEVVKDFRAYSLLSFEFRLPNGADRKVFQVTNWDFLFLSMFIYNKLIKLNEDILWGKKPNLFEKILIKIGNKLYN
jgi:hypothetical protein